ncbi:hypothetical protein VP1G_10951 [Cytospora mali]|uniref:Uncharacterized protein n=1 Tax=Cytospora mali TaxID=578113 RepID=A0A194V2S1_CYTMA|nr:hypothetical protein VP1G_10951 [Valsa mali var. pyri (nom. inval.)]
MDEALPVTIVPPFDELDSPELTTTELEIPEDGTDRDEDSEGLDDVEIKLDGGKLPHDVVLLAPLDIPGVDDPGVVLRAEDRELLDPVDTLSRLLITEEDGLIVSVVALVVVRTVIREDKSFVVMVEIKLLLIVVSKVDGGMPLLDTDDDGTTKFEDELRVKVFNIVVVKSVICVVERFVAMVVTRLVVIVVGKLMLATMLLELSPGREELGPEDDGTTELGTVEEAVREDDVPEDGASDDDTPEDGMLDEGTPLELCQPTNKNTPQTNLELPRDVEDTVDADEMPPVDGTLLVRVQEIVSYLESVSDGEELVAEELAEKLLLDESAAVELGWMLDNGEEPGTVTLSEDDRTLDEGVFELRKCKQNFLANQSSALLTFGLNQTWQVVSWMAEMSQQKTQKMDYQEELQTSLLTRKTELG